MIEEDTKIGISLGELYTDSGPNFFFVLRGIA